MSSSIAAIGAHDGEQAGHGVVVIAVRGQVSAFMQQGLKIERILCQALFDTIQIRQVGELFGKLYFSA